MGDLTKNLSRSEFACRCGCGFDTIDFELVDVLQKTIDHFAEKYNERIFCKISGGNRCVEHNEKIQKKYNKSYKPYSSKSQHLDGRGADFKLYKGKMSSDNQINSNEVYNYLISKYSNCFGIGWYHNRTHLDTRTNSKARWGI